MFVHWSFLLLVGYVAYTGWQAGQDLRGISGQLVYLAIVFTCVVMHEFGHALTAKKLGIRTRDITLLPIGGVASLERMPEEPKSEFLITIAGPLVNLVLVVLAVAIQLIVFQRLTILEDDLLAFPTMAAMLSFLIVVNLGLFIFNLIPAFPMDGGRILRSLLSMRLGRPKATQIASIVGKVFAGLFVVWGLFGNPFMVLIGLFVYFGAAQEYRMVKRRSALRDMRVDQIMRTNFCIMEGTLPVDVAMADLLFKQGNEVIVMDHGNYQGILGREALVHAFREGLGGAAIGSLAISKAPSLRPEERVQDVSQGTQAAQWSVMPVIDDGTIFGVVSMEDVLDPTIDGVGTSSDIATTADRSIGKPEAKRP